MKYRSYLLIALASTMLVTCLSFSGCTATTGSLNQPLAQLNAVQKSNATIKILNFKYNPATLKIKAGDIVKFINSDGEPHTVTAKDGEFDSKAIDTNETWTHTFSKVGTFPYICAIHPFMAGMIAVTSTGEKNATSKVH